MRLTTFALLASFAVNAVTAAPAPLAESANFALPNTGSQGDKVVLPLPDTNVNLQDLSNLTPSKTATLQYAEPANAGTYAASLKFNMIYPQVTLENSAFVTNLICSMDSTSMTITFQTKASFDVAMQWPQSKLVLITNNAACNPSNERGVYLGKSYSANAETLTIILQVSPQEWRDVAETLEISYGNLVSKTTSSTSSKTSSTTSSTFTTTTSLTTSSKSTSTTSSITSSISTSKASSMTSPTTTSKSTSTTLSTSTSTTSSTTSKSSTTSTSPTSTPTTSKATSTTAPSTSTQTTSKATTPTTFTTITASTTSQLVCNADNCLRALENYQAYAQGFCSTYTNVGATSTPSYVPAECTPSRLSSACTCLAYTMASSSTSVSSMSVSTEPTTTNPQMTSTPSLSGSATTTSTPSSSGSATTTSTPSSSGSATTTSTPSLSGSATTTSTPSLSGPATTTSTPSLSGSATTTSTPSLSGSATTTSTPSSSGSATTTSTPSYSATTTSASSSSGSATTTPMSGSSASAATTSTQSSAATSTGSPTTIAISAVTSMDAAQQSIYNMMESNLDLNAAGDILLNLGGLASQNPTIEAEPFQPDNATYQATLQAALIADGLDSAATLLQAAVNDLGSAYASSYAITPAMGIQENLPAGYVLYTDPVGKRGYSSSLEPDYPPSSVPLHKRFSLEDALELGNNLLTSDLVDAICEVCDDFSDAENAYNAAVALYQLTHPGASAPPAELATVSVTSSVDVTVPPNYVLASDESGDSVTCVDCSLTVSSIELEGQVMIVLATNSILSAILNVTYSATSNLVLGLTSTGAYSGSFDTALSTQQLTSLSSPNIFNIAPQFIYSVGASYQTDSAVSVTAGASMSLSGAATSMDLQAGTASNAINWSPSGTITYPSFDSASTVVLTPYILTSIEMTVQILGQTVQNAATLTQQTNIGFDTQVLTSTTSYEKRSLAKRLLFSNLVAEVAAAAVAAAAAVVDEVAVAVEPTCPAGGLLLAVSMSSTNQAYFGSGSPQVLFTQSYPFGSRCFVVPGVQEVSSSATSSSAITAPLATTIHTTNPLATTTSISSEPITTSATTTSLTPTPSTSSALSDPSPSTTTPQAATTGWCPTPYSYGLITEGGSSYTLNCGMTMSSSTLEIGSAGGPAGITDMAACLDWCNSWGSDCQVALWDESQSYSCILFTGVGSTSTSTEAAYAVRVPAAPAAPYCPSPYSVGPISEGGSDYVLTCGESMGGSELGSAGGAAGINDMQECLDWCNSWGGSCMVAMWDTSQDYSCILFETVGAGSPSGTAAYAVKSL